MNKVLQDRYVRGLEDEDKKLKLYAAVNEGKGSRRIQTD